MSRLLAWLKLLSQIAIVLGLSLGGCRSTSVEPPPVDYYEISISQGSGSGRYAMGSTIHIWADPYEPGWLFDSWQGDTSYVSDVRSMHITLVMPARDIQLRAAYKAAPIWNVVHEVIAGRDVYSYFPDILRGVIVFFHGSGGDAREWTDVGAERRHFFDDAVARGYAIVTIDSHDRVDKQWDLSWPADSNPDVQAVKIMLATFIASGKMTSDTAVYAVGMSQGGGFAMLAAYLFGMKAVAIWCGTGQEDVRALTTVPTIWCLAEHDPIIDRKEVKAYYYQPLVERGVDAAFYIHPPTPLYPLYFVGSQGIDKAGSTQLFTDLKTQGYLDANNFLIANPRLSQWEQRIGTTYPEEVRRDIRDRLFVAYAEHEFYSDCDERVLDFFAAHR